jgi:hypothetical protein
MMDDLQIAMAIIGVTWEVRGGRGKGKYPFNIFST